MEEFGEYMASLDRSCPVKEGDRLIDWDQDRGVARNVRGDTTIYFDMHYDNGSVIRSFVWNETDFRLEE